MYYMYAHIVATFGQLCKALCDIDPCTFVRFEYTQVQLEQEFLRHYHHEVANKGLE